MPQVGSQIITDDEIIKAGTWGIDWTDQLAAGETITSVVIAVTQDDCDGDDVTATVAPEAAVIGGAGKNTTCQVVGTAMTAQHYYYLHHTITTSAGNVLTDYIRLYCECC